MQTLQDQIADFITEKLNGVRCDSCTHSGRDDVCKNCDRNGVKWAAGYWFCYGMACEIVAMMMEGKA